MPLLEIVKYPHPVLHEKSKQIERFDTEIKQLAQNMGETMHAARGIGLAAVQVAQLKRLLVLDLSGMDEDSEDFKEGESRSAKDRPLNSENVEVYINPSIIKSWGETSYEEGCLSIPGVYGEVRRASNLIVEYNDLEGNTIEEEVAGLKSIVLQHEIDHLNGVLFTDRVGPMQRMMILKKYQKLQSEPEE